MLQKFSTSQNMQNAHFTSTSRSLSDKKTSTFCRMCDQPFNTSHIL